MERSSLAPLQVGLDSKNKRTDYIKVQFMSILLVKCAEPALKLLLKRARMQSHIMDAT